MSTTSKRRKLSPSTDNENQGSSASASRTNAYYKQASTWNLEQDYETRPRKQKVKGKESTRLPIKTADGAIVQVAQSEQVEEADSDLEWLEDEDTEPLQDETPVEIEEKPTVPVRQQILEAKEELAKIALVLNEEPEDNIGAFKAMAQVGQSKNITIKKLTIATQLTVYKDVIPGYRIRPLSEEDMEVKVSKDVRKVRAYEQALVGGYQAYIQELAQLAKASGRSKEVRSLASLALSCVGALLSAVPHFNFRGELLKILVGKLSTRRVDEDFVKCRQAIESLFQADEDGTPSLDAVALLVKMFKARSYRVDESVLNTFLHLRLLSELSFKGSTNRVDRPGKDDEPRELKKLKEKPVFRTKKEKKAMRERKAVEKEMVQADATVSHEETDRMQSETLKLVFVTYFRILKMRLPTLMGAVLEGLARYAHLINQQFFGDLLEALKDLIGHAETGDDLEDEEDDFEDDVETRRNLTREALLCTITAFALLEGQDAHKAQSSLSLDLSFFISHLYRQLYALSLDPDVELTANALRLIDPDQSTRNHSAMNKVNIQTTTVLLLRSLNSILVPTLGARAIPPLRIAAFTKQLLTLSLHVPEKSCTATLALMDKVTKTHEKKIAALWNTEERKGDGFFDALSTEVEGSNPYASTVWEGELLRKHYCPAVREGVKRVEKNVLGLR